MSDARFPLIDTRIVQRNLANGRLSRADYDKYLAELPDLTGRAERVSVPLTRVETRTGAVIRPKPADPESDE